jgi:hypothetical protein
MADPNVILNYHLPRIRSATVPHLLADNIVAVVVRPYQRDLARD